jgi:mono/diheme cytochrome c family protein
LLATNLTESIPVLTPNGMTTQSWYYPSPSDCLQCHTAVANYVLGVNARQLNGNLAYSNGVTDNQLRALNRAGLLYPAIDESQIGGIEQLSSLTNAAASYVQRARSYLDANCAQCHQLNGSGPTFDGRYDTPLTNQNIVNAILAKGNLGDPATRVVVPSDVWRSLLWVRMNTNTATLVMPPLARNIIDTNAVQIMGDWINSLGGTPALAPPSITPAAGAFANFASVALLTNNGGAAIYYTLDGTLPTNGSILYTAPFLVTSNVVITASAFESGYINSFASTAQFAIQPLLFTSDGAFVGGQFTLPVLGVAETSYILQASTDLIHWTPISTNVPSTNAFILTDTNAAGFPWRFYRMVQLP